MNIEKIAYTMTCAVAVIDLVRPDWRAGYSIEHGRQHAPREGRPRQRNHALEHTGAIELLRIARLPDGDHPRDVRGSTNILAA